MCKLIDMNTNIPSFVPGKYVVIVIEDKASGRHEVSYMLFKL